jgi:hypothetical protein
MLNTEHRQYLRITERKGCCVHVGTGCRPLYFTCGNQMELCFLRGEGTREEVKAVSKKYHKYVTRREKFVTWISGLQKLLRSHSLERSLPHWRRAEKGRKSLSLFLVSALLFSTKLGAMNSWWECRHLMTVR